MRDMGERFFICGSPTQARATQPRRACLGAIALLGIQEPQMLVVDSWRRVANKKQLAELDAKAAATTQDAPAPKRGKRGRPAGGS